MSASTTTMTSSSSAQSSSVLARSEKARTESAGGVAPNAAGSGSASGGAAPSAEAVATPTIAVNRSGATSPSRELAGSPATPQELSRFPRIIGLQHSSAADSSTVVLELEDQVQYEAHRLSEPDRIYFDLHGTRLPPDIAGKTNGVGDALIKRIRVAQPVAGITRLVLETRGTSTFSASLQANPYRLVVEVRKIGADAKGAVNVLPRATEAARSKAGTALAPRARGSAHEVRMRIVVDPGHGGWDMGTVGRRGLLEKHVVLEIAQRLGKLLETRLGSEVIYTRHDDNYIPLDQRAVIANQAQADLLVSVHANYSDVASARGVETYYTNLFSTPDAKDLEMRADRSKTAVTTSLTPVELRERAEQSRRLATSVQRSLYEALSVQNPGLPDRGIKEAGFEVLTESAMPGILAEVSFVSSPTDEQKLRSEDYREQIAEALYRGIARYAATSRLVKVASAGK